MNAVEPAILAEMRAWIADCVSGLALYDEGAEIADASPAAIVRWVERRYCGGVTQFIRDGEGSPGCVCKREDDESGECRACALSLGPCVCEGCEPDGGAS